MPKRRKKQVRQNKDEPKQMKESPVLRTEQYHVDSTTIYEADGKIKLQNMLNDRYAQGWELEQAFMAGLEMFVIYKKIDSEKGAISNEKTGA